MSRAKGLVFTLLALVALVTAGWTTPRGATVVGSDPYPLGKFYQGVGPVNVYSSTKGYTTVNPANLVGTKKVVVIIGDSLTANSVNTAYTITQSGNLQVNAGDGGLYNASDPAFGASNGSVAPYISSVAGPLGDSIVTGGYATWAIVVANGMGSSAIGDWAQFGALNKNITTIADRLAVLGLTPSAWIWHGGPNDNNLGTTQIAYKAGLDSVIATIRTKYPTVPILIGVASQAGLGNTSAAIQAAQASVLSAPGKIYAGVNSDAFSSGDFGDGTHFSVSGRASWVSGTITKLVAAGF